MTFGPPFAALHIAREPFPKPSCFAVTIIVQAASISQWAFELRADELSLSPLHETLYLFAGSIRHTIRILFHCTSALSTVNRPFEKLDPFNAYDNDKILQYHKFIDNKRWH